jgi:hypothetical protein
VGGTLWADLGAAIALVLVIEGALPFLNPASWRRAMQVLSKLDDRSVRVVGLISMLSGLLLLYLVRHGTAGT